MATKKQTNLTLGMITKKVEELILDDREFIFEGERVWHDGEDVRHGHEIVCTLDIEELDIAKCLVKLTGYVCHNPWTGLPEGTM